MGHYRDASEGRDGKVKGEWGMGEGKGKRKWGNNGVCVGVRGMRATPGRRAPNPPHWFRSNRERNTNQSHDANVRTTFSDLTPMIVARFC